jgi:hypothetical protein
LVRADDRAVNDGPGLVYLELKLAEDCGPVTVLRPIGESVVDRLPRTEALGQIAPRHPRLGAIKHCFDEEPIVRNGSSALLRQDSLQSTPLIVRERVSLHRDF